MNHQVKETINDKNRSESNKFRVQTENSPHSSVLGEKKNKKNNKA